jgi:TPR repeat protein
MFQEGRVVAQDYTEAVRLYRLAAAQGHAGGQLGLAYLYEFGLGVAADTTEAIRLYHLAAAQGDAFASAALARLGA